ncbi:MAG: hypothetical protein ACRC62_38860 [Microcoleus sp.]
MDYLVCITANKEEGRGKRERWGELSITNPQSPIPNPQSPIPNSQSPIPH